MTNTEHAFRHFVDYSDRRVESTDRDPVTGKVSVRSYFMYAWSEVPSSTWVVTYRPNVEMFQAALDQITNHPETWNQADWLSELAPSVEDLSVAAAPECGTAGCLAGTVALLAGARPLARLTPAGRTILEWATVREPGSDREITVNDFAERELGIGPLDGLGELFSATNSLFDLWDRALVLCGGALVRPADEVIAEAQEVSSHLYYNGPADDEDRYLDGDYGDED